MPRGLDGLWQHGEENGAASLRKIMTRRVWTPPLKSGRKARAVSGVETLMRYRPLWGTWTSERIAAGDRRPPKLVPDYLSGQVLDLEAIPEPGDLVPGTRHDRIPTGASILGATPESGTPER